MIKNNNKLNKKNLLLSLRLDFSWLLPVKSHRKINIFKMQSSMLDVILITILLASIVFAVPLDQTNINQLSPHQRNIVQQQINAGRDVSEFQITPSNSGGFLLTDTIQSLIITSEGHVSGSGIPSGTIEAITITNFNPATSLGTAIVPSAGSTVPEEGWSFRQINGHTYKIKNEALEFFRNNPKATWDDARKSFVVSGNWEFNTIQHGVVDRVVRKKDDIAFNAFTAEITKTSDVELFDADDKKPNKKGVQLGKEKTVTTRNTADVKTSETTYVFSSKDFSEKGSIEVSYKDGLRSQTNIKDQNTALFSIDNQGRINGIITKGLLTPKEALDAISDPVLKEAVRQDMLVNSNIHEGRWDIMSASEKVGTFFKAFNEFKGLASVTSLLSDNYDEYVVNRRNYLNNRFCVFMGIGSCLKSEICEHKVIHSGGGSLIGNVGGTPRLGVASVRGEKSFSIDTPQGIGFVYKVQYHLENPDNQEMTYNIWFESSSSSRKWFASDKKIAAFQEVTSLPNDKDGLKRFSYNDYDRVCIRFDPGIYKLNSKNKRVSEHCDVFTSDYQEPSQNEVKQAQQSTGKDGDI